MPSQLIQRNRFVIAGKAMAVLVIVLGSSVAPGVNAQGTRFTSDLSGNLLSKASGGLSAPQIQTQPQPQIVEPGKSASFSVVLVDSQGVTYQWRFNGNPINGATGDSLTISNVTAANEGLYSVVVTNSINNVTSNSANLYIDTDGDGLPDSWEQANFGNLNQTANGDFDGDGVSNLDEFRDGTNPTVSTSFKTSLTIQTDGGGTVNISPVKTRYNQGDTVTLTAVPFSPNTFRGWSGDAIGTTNPINITMSANRAVFARFIAAPLPPGAISWWQAENNALDAMGANNGTLVNGVTFVNGEVGKAFNFNGTNQSVDVPDSASLRPSSVTLEAWVSSNNTNGTQGIFSKPLGGGTLDSYTLFVQNGGLYGAIANGNGFGNFISVAYTPTAGTWHHVAYTFDNTTKIQALYIDGVQAATGSAGAGMTIGYDSQPMLLGRDIENGSPNYFFNGAIDEATIYNRALNPDEIAAIYSVGVAGKAAPNPYLTSASPLPDGVFNINYSYQLTAVGTNPLAFSLGSGALPPGLNLSSAGLISGIPTAPGVYSFTIHLTNGASQSSDQMVSLKIVGPVTPPGLVGWWRAENNALDSAGSNNGTTSVNGAGYATGEVGQAFSLDGVAGYIQIPDAPALRPASLTFETWMLFSAAPSGIRAIAAKPVGAGTADSFAIWYSSPQLFCTFNDAGGNGPFLSATFTPNVGQWYHVACSYDAVTRQATLYLNGVVVSSAYANLTIAYDNQPLLLGRDNENGSALYFFNGRIDEAALYNRALGSSEVAAIYSAGPAGKVSSGPYFNTTTPLADGVLNQSYNQTISSIRGSPPVTYAIVSGSLPPNVTLSSGGVISGSPTAAGTFTFTVRATDNASKTTDQVFSIQVYGRIAPAPGLVSWWRAENNANDSIGSNNCTLFNGAAFNTGKVGQAFWLDGVDDYIDVPDAASLHPASVTLEGWVSFNYTAGTQIIACKPLGAGNLDSYGLWLESGNLKGAICDSNGFAPILSVPFVPVIGQWYHVAYTFDDATKQQALYLNGVQVGFGVAPTSIGYDNHQFTIGRDIENGSSQFNLVGRIDELAFYNRALAPNEIAAIASAGSAGRTISGPYFTTPAVLPDAAIQTPYSQSIASTRGTGSVTFSVVGGSLPPGLGMSNAGLISGTPTTIGSFSFTVRATDSNSVTSDQAFTLQVVPRVPPPAGIISWWRAENNANDSIGNNTGTLNNGATFGTGRVAKAFALDGVDDYVSIVDSASLHPSSITLEGWVNFSSTSGAPHIFSKTIGNSSQDSFAVFLFGGNLNGLVTDASFDYSQLSVPFTPVLGQWYHLAFTFDNVTKQQSLYVNGAIVAANISNRQIGYDNHPMLLGADIENGNPSFFLNGRIDEAAIYNRALTGAEIALLYSAGSFGKTTVGPYFTNSPQLADGAVGVAYSQTVSTLRGTSPITFSVVGGALPAGLSLASNGSITGIPTAAGDSTVVIRATDNVGQFADEAFGVHIGLRAHFASGLVSWWRAEGNATDSFGTNNGTLTNGATFTTGKVGQGFAFNATNDAVTVPDSNSLRPSSLTLEGWVMFNGPDGDRTIFAKPLGTGDGDSYIVFMESGSLKALVSDTGGEGGRLQYPFVPTPGRWYHIAYTFDGPTKQQALYVDTALVATNFSSKNPAYDTNPFLLGCDFSNTQYAFSLQGRIDEAALYNRALSSSEIAAIYAAGSAGKRTLFPVETWKLTNLGDADAPDSGDPDHDNVPNLIEYAFGMNPAANDFALLPQVSTFTYAEGKRLRIIFPRDPTRNDITIEVQVATDLAAANWTTVASSVNGAPTTGAGYVGGDGAGSGIKQVEVRDTVNIAGASPPHRFMRIRVSRSAF